MRHAPDAAVLLEVAAGAADGRPVAPTTSVRSWLACTASRSRLPPACRPLRQVLRPRRQLPPIRAPARAGARRARPNGSSRPRLPPCSRHPPPDAATRSVAAATPSASRRRQHRTDVRGLGADGPSRAARHDPCGVHAGRRWSAVADGGGHVLAPERRPPREVRTASRGRRGCASATPPARMWSCSCSSRASRPRPRPRRHRRPPPNRPRTRSSRPRRPKRRARFPRRLRAGHAGTDRRSAGRRRVDLDDLVDAPPESRQVADRPARRGVPGLRADRRTDLTWRAPTPRRSRR